MRRTWDDRYREALADGKGDGPPAAWLSAHEGLLAVAPRGPALDVACGTGRNAMYLAALGFTVDAVDASAVAIEHLAAVAHQRSLPVRAQRLDLATDALPGAGYQVIVCTYFLDRRLFAPLARALSPGGLLVFETFLGADPDATYGPQDPEHVLEPGELRSAFAGLAVVAYREERPEPGARGVASLVGQAPSGLRLEAP